MRYFCFSVHAAVIAINEALDKGVDADTLEALLNPNACLNGITKENANEYQSRLSSAKQRKCQAALNKVSFVLVVNWHASWFSPPSSGIVTCSFVITAEIDDFA